MGSSSNFNLNFKVCQLCDQPSHSAISYPWMYSKCIISGCIDLRMLLICESNISKEKKFLKCQFPNCEGFEWLEDALKATSKGSSILKCYLCGDNDHVGKDCAWDSSPCPRLGCTGWRHVGTSHTEQNPLKKYLKCDHCHGFEWLMYVIAKHEATSRQEQLLRKIHGSSKGKGLHFTSQLPTDDLCNEFNLKALLPKCFHCKAIEHMARDCLWKSTPCKGQGCNARMKLGTSSRQWSLGQKYLKCETCGTFAWLKDMM